MGGKLKFTWDDAKALANLRKHRVTFDEACRVFNDPLALAIDDPDHSSFESRALLLGETRPGRLLTVSYVERTEVIRLISARPATGHERRMYEGGDTVAEMRAEYDFSKGVRGKYAARYAAGTNLVHLDVDVLQYFQNSDAVNRALRALIPLIEEARADASPPKPIRKAQDGDE
jgi:uncharacterized protein